MQLAGATGACAYGIVVDNNVAYWGDDLGVRAVATAPGSNVKTLYANTEGPFVGLARDSGITYWTSASGIMKYDTSESYMAATYSGGHSLALAAGSLYWREKFGEVRGVPTSGGSYVTYATGQTDLGPTPHAVASDGASLFWSNTSDLVTMSVSATDGGAPQVLVAGTGGGPLAVANSSVYFFQYPVGLRSVQKGGGTPTTIVSFAADVGDVAIDNLYAYFVDYNFGLRRAPLAGGPWSKLTDSSWFGQSSYGIAIDSTSVYWTVCYGTLAGSVWKLTPR